MRTPPQKYRMATPGSVHSSINNKVKYQPPSQKLHELELLEGDGHYQLFRLKGTLKAEKNYME